MHERLPGMSDSTDNVPSLEGYIIYAWWLSSYWHLRREWLYDQDDDANESEAICKCKTVLYKPPVLYLVGFKVQRFSSTHLHMCSLSLWTPCRRSKKGSSEENYANIVTECQFFVADCTNTWLVLAATWCLWLKKNMVNNGLIQRRPSHSIVVLRSII